MEKNFVKIIVKAYLLVESNVLSVSDFLEAETALLNTMELLKLCY